MDPLSAWSESPWSDEGGQALVVAILGVAIAAATIVGLRDAQERILADAHVRRAGEAAAEAAGAAVADAQAILVAASRDEQGRRATVVGRAALEALVSDPAVADAALRAATELALENHAGPPTGLRIGDTGRALEITLTLGRHRQRVAIGSACCRP